MDFQCANTGGAANFGGGLQWTILGHCHSDILVNALHIKHMLIS